MINGQKWFDADGNVIHAHGGHMLQFDGFYYWYGEDRRENFYVACYRSKDLKKWEFMSHSLTTNSKCEHTRLKMADLSLFHDIDGEKRKVNIERPKVLYNELTKKFVMWMHYENGENYQDARCAIATSDTPDGEFVYHGSFNPFGQMSRDCTLFKDENEAYFISASRDNADLHIYTLADDYLNVDRWVNTIWQGEYREAPAVFKKDNRYYMLSSYCTGWNPNQGKWAVSDKIDGKWSLLKNFGDETTFKSQPAFVMPITQNGEEKFYYFGDRWGGGGEKYFNSTYVVLEIKFDKNGPYIEYTDKCDLFV